MKENVKNTTKALYTMCICLIVVMGVLFLGNSLTKGTYSAGTVLTKNTKYCSKSGYVLNDSKCCPSGYGLYNGGVSCCPSGYSWSSNDSICVNSSGKQKSPTAAVAASTCKAGNILNGNTCTANSSSSSSGGTSCEIDSQGKCAGIYGASNCVMDSKGCWVKKSTTGTSGAGCYNVGNAQGNHYVWLDKAPSHGTLVADSYCESKDNKKYTYKFYNKDGSVSLGVKTCIVNQSTGSCTTAITPPSCSGQWSGQKNCPTNSVKVGPNFFANKDDSGNFYNLIGDSSWYCCDGDSTGGGGGDIPDPIPNPPTTPSTSSNPPSSSTVTENPKTGSIAIFMVWVIAIGTLIYSIAYFKQSKFE